MSAVQYIHMYREHMYMSKYGERQHRRGEAHPGFGTYQVGRMVKKWRLWKV